MRKIARRVMQDASIGYSATRILRGCTMYTRSGVLNGELHDARVYVRTGERTYVVRVESVHERHYEHLEGIAFPPVSLNSLRTHVKIEGRSRRRGSLPRSKRISSIPLPREIARKVVSRRERSPTVIDVSRNQLSIALSRRGEEKRGFHGSRRQTAGWNEAGWDGSKQKKKRVEGRTRIKRKRRSLVRNRGRIIE